jgi:uncharacterized protein YndB with AHSA1/START domain
MLDVTVEAYISAPREAVYDRIADLAVRPAWCDHYMKDFRLAHPRAQGKGAAARYLLDAPRNRLYVETSIVEAERARHLVEATHGGRGGRTKGEMVWDLSRAGSGLTRVEVSVLLDPGTPREAFKARLGSQGWLRRQTKAALERLRVILEEEPDVELARATVAGFEPLKAPRFGTSPRPIRG